MTPTRTAKLANLTQPEPGVFHLGFQFEGQPGITRGQPAYERVQITHDQLCTIAADAVVMALGWKGRVTHETP